MILVGLESMPNNIMYVENVVMLKLSVHKKWPANVCNYNALVKCRVSYA